MADNARIEELRRRVQQDPASIAFAQLAEEYRRAGEYEEAIRVCRQGLAQHPDYLSARVTLGRALLDTGQLADAEAELERVLEVAHDNVAAVHALADLRRRRDSAPLADAASVASDPSTPVSDLDLAFRASDASFVQALQSLDAIPNDFGLPTAPVWATTEHLSAAATPVDPALAELETWLAAIHADRLRRAPLRR